MSKTLIVFAALVVVAVVTAVLAIVSLLQERRARALRVRDSADG